MERKMAKNGEFNINTNLFSRGNMEMEPDIENMTISEYLKYEDSIWEHDDDSEEDQEEDGDDGDTFDTWDITIEDAERIRKNFNVPDEIDKIEGDFNPTKDLEELERLLSKEPQSNFMEIQSFLKPYKLCIGGGAWILNKLRRSIANRTSWMLYKWYVKFPMTMDVARRRRLGALLRACRLFISLSKSRGVLTTKGWNSRSPRLGLCGNLVADKQQVTAYTSNAQDVVLGC
ncbi:hypothetical protein Tco_0699287 [Tanacetum coccineum]